MNTVFRGTRVGADGQPGSEEALAELRERLRRGQSLRELSVHQLRMGTGLGRTTISQALNDGNPAPSARTVAALAKVLRLEADPLLDLLQAAAPPSDRGTADGGDTVDVRHEGEVPADAASLPGASAGRRVLLHAAAAVAVAAGTVVATVAIWTPSPHHGSGNADSPAPRSRPAPSSSPPVRIESVAQFSDSEPGNQSFALPDRVLMNPGQLSRFNSEIFTKSRAFRSWYADHKASRLDSGYTTVTVRGNGGQTVRITGMKVDKDCRKPVAGTLFSSPSQGDAANIAMSFDLDLPDPPAQDMGFTTAERLHPLQTEFFAHHSISLAAGETQTLTIGASTERYDCRFTLQMEVATPGGPFTEEIDDNGRPFEVTAVAKPTKPGHWLSGYQAAYIGGPAYNLLTGWRRVDPDTFR